MGWRLAVVLCVCLVFTPDACARGRSGGGGGGRAASAATAVAVRSYTRNGRPVRGHMRSAPDGIVSNNWSSYGNQNPFTGTWGTKHYPGDGGGYSAPSGVPDSYAAPVPAGAYRYNPGLGFWDRGPMPYDPYGGTYVQPTPAEDPGCKKCGAAVEMRWGSYCEGCRASFERGIRPAWWPEEAR